jgi:threonine synthase
MPQDTSVNLQCMHCRTKFPVYPLISYCEKCGAMLEYQANLPDKQAVKFSGTLRFWRYRQMLPPVHNTVSLGEGGTPLHKAVRLAKTMGLTNLYLKDETRNPTNSYRDRAAALLTSNAIDLHSDTLVCATNGNMGASLAAYSAKAGLNCHVIVPKEVDVGKLAQMLAYDAIIEEYGEIIDDSICKADAIGKETGWYQATAELNPFVVEAQKTIAFEIFEQNGVPEWMIVSMGSGGTIYSIWKGFKELKQIGLTKTLPKMVGVQSDGCAFIVNATKPFDGKACSPSTRALAILVGNPLQRELATKAITESEGLALTVSDQDILSAELQIAKLEGVFAEPASAITVAALKKLLEEKNIDKDSSVICLITGSGLKATDVLQALTKKQKAAGLGLAVSTKQKILKILSEKDTYGYDLWKQLGKIMTRAAIYQHLNELSDKGLVIGYEEGGKKFFRVTERGRKVLAAFDDIQLLM